MSGNDAMAEKTMADKRESNVTETPKDLRGLAPESWHCVDCGVNTAAGMSTRAELEAAFAAGKESVDQVIDNKSEVYTVCKEIWKAARMEELGGCLCICLEKRLGRKLGPKDFLPDHPFNGPDVPGTPRLLNRRWGKPSPPTTVTIHKPAG
jgi:hypothetical protein